MALLIVFDIVAVVAGSVTVGIAIYMISRMFKGSDNQFGENALLYAIFSLMLGACLTVGLCIAKAGVADKLLPQCPVCEETVTSAFCPDCGCEPRMKEPPNYECEMCGAEWRSAFCGDCSSPMGQED